MLFEAKVISVIQKFDRWMIPEIDDNGKVRGRKNHGDFGYETLLETFVFNAPELLGAAEIKLWTVEPMQVGAHYIINIEKQEPN